MAAKKSKKSKKSLDKSQQDQPQLGNNVEVAEVVDFPTSIRYDIDLEPDGKRSNQHLLLHIYGGNSAGVQNLLTQLDEKSTYVIRMTQLQPATEFHHLPASVSVRVHYAQPEPIRSQDGRSVRCGSFTDQVIQTLVDIMGDEQIVQCRPASRPI